VAKGVDAPETTQCKRGPWRSGLPPPMKPQWACYKLGETIEQPCSDVLSHTPEVCKGAHLSNKYPAIQKVTTHGESVHPQQSVELS
jgi:hypothetical protein